MPSRFDNAVATGILDVSVVADVSFAAVATAAAFLSASAAASAAAPRQDIQLCKARREKAPTKNNLLDER